MAKTDNHPSTSEYRIVLTIYPDAFDLPEFIGVQVDTFSTEAEGEAPYKMHSLRFGSRRSILDRLHPAAENDVVRALGDILTAYRPLTLFD